MMLLLVAFLFLLLMALLLLPAFFLRRRAPFNLLSVVPLLLEDLLLNAAHLLFRRGTGGRFTALLLMVIFLLLMTTALRTTTSSASVVLNLTAVAHLRYIQKPMSNAHPHNTSVIPVYHIDSIEPLLDLGYKYVVNGHPMTESEYKNLLKSIDVWKIFNPDKNTEPLNVTMLIYEH